MRRAAPPRPVRERTGAQRTVAVWFPDWPVAAAGVPPEVPAAVLHANRVVARSPAAAAEGVAVGHRRREAQRRCPELVLLDHDPDRDARTFEPVAHTVGEIAPRLEVVEPGWLCLAARGPSRYFGGDAALATHLRSVLDALRSAHAGGAQGLGAAGAPYVGVADGRFAASLAARRAAAHPGRTLVVAPGDAAGFLAPLPITWLQHLGEATPELVNLFARLGVARLGDLAALPGPDVLGRFGSAGLHAHRLAGGLDPRRADGEPPPPGRGVEQSFDEPVTELAPVLFAARHLADVLAGHLAANGEVCTRLLVTVETDHGERSERAWYRAAGMSMLAMVDRVRWQLAAWTTAGDLTAGVVVLRLVPEEVRHDSGEQLGLWGGRSAADERALRAIARLCTLAGEAGVLVPAWQGGRLPGARYRWVPAATTELLDPDRLRPPRGEGPWPGALPAPSPSVVLPEPIPVEVADADGRPVAVSGRGELSAAPATLTPTGPAGSADRTWPRPVLAWAGPWPLDERWWDPARARRAARLQVVTGAGTVRTPGRVGEIDGDLQQAHLLLAEHRRWWITATY